MADRPWPQKAFRLKILLFDCRDSFTYNLAQVMGEIIEPIDRLDVIRHDRLNLDQADGYDRVVLSPGPGLPEEMANLFGLIKKLAPKVPILGVCLGHQALAQAFGGKLINLQKVYHGVKSNVKILVKTRVFDGLVQNGRGEIAIEAGRYHSWLVDSQGFPKELTVTAIDETGQIMGLSHRSLDIHGVQFHPESILTPMGPLMLKNFLFNKAHDPNGFPIESNRELPRVFA
ncbi:MAG: aminodeoxychorismate/anthranilate synthase component II [Deltaproteobacteria bacterium]|nr:aminodeoxychorismate/anthranilate synthase component II [Deltaproteobacteria bacterium]